MEDLVVTLKHLLDEVNISNYGCGRTDHLFQAESWQELSGILNEYIGNNGEDADSTYQTKMLQLIANVYPLIHLQGLMILLAWERWLQQWLKRTLWWMRMRQTPITRSNLMCCMVSMGKKSSTKQMTWSMMLHVGSMWGWPSPWNMLNRHVDLHQAWLEHGSNITSKFAIGKEENEDSNQDGDDAVPSHHCVDRRGCHMYDWSARWCHKYLGYTRKVTHQTDTFQITILVNLQGTIHWSMYKSSTTTGHTSLTHGISSTILFQRCQLSGIGDNQECLECVNLIRYDCILNT